MLILDQLFEINLEPNLEIYMLGWAVPVKLKWVLVFLLLILQLCHFSAIIEETYHKLVAQLCTVNERNCQSTRTNIHHITA